MILTGKLIAESPIYRGNARKTLFTRDGDGSQKLISLAGEIQGTAQSLMDAFIGESKNGRNKGLLNQLWERFYQEALPLGLIRKVSCRLNDSSYPQDRLFDLRMGLRLDDDRWASESNANYKMETLYKNSEFEFEMNVNDSILKNNQNEVKLYYVLQELREGRFWFGAGKSKGLGRCRLELDKKWSVSSESLRLRTKTNHLTFNISICASNPILVGWNWGKIDPEQPAFAVIDGKLLLQAMRAIPDVIRERLEFALGGPIPGIEPWKKKFSDYLPRVLAIWLQENSSSEGEAWLFPRIGLESLKSGKFAIPEKILERLDDIVDQAFDSSEAAENAFKERMGNKAKKYKRILEVLTHERRTGHQFNQTAWKLLADTLGLPEKLSEQLALVIHDEQKLTDLLAMSCDPLFKNFFQQIDQQVNLLRSDSWVDLEIENRQAHLKIKQMLMSGAITENDWTNRNHPPEGVKAVYWREFLDAHQRVSFLHMMNPQNLRKSIVNDQNHIEFLKNYRSRVRQELAQSENTDFRAGGTQNRHVSKKYGKPYDTVFMRMLTWSQSRSEEGQWEVYIPGSTIKGAFRRRASQILKTLWGEQRKTDELLNLLFGTQRQRGIVFFSDAHLMNPYEPEKTWCSMDGIRMDPKTGKPIENAKADYLYAYGENLVFNCQFDLQDIDEKMIPALSLLNHLLTDFQAGNIPLGGEKTSGFGWLKAVIDQAIWRESSRETIGGQLFGQFDNMTEGVWQKAIWTGADLAKKLNNLPSLFTNTERSPESPPRARDGYISHRSFGGYGGELHLEGEVLTPVSIRESGQPSFEATLENDPVYGWDFFSISPPMREHRAGDRLYALPAKSLKGMLRHIYTIVSNSREESQRLIELNPTDALFGWVGNGPNQAIMGRISVNFGIFTDPRLAWFRVPYPYGQWQFEAGQWQEKPGKKVNVIRIADQWRLFPHAPLAPVVNQMEAFEPDTFQADYFRAVLPGSKFHFTIRFWNLEKIELQRLIWSVILEDKLAHKIGKNRYLGFGSLRLQLTPESHLIDWGRRYSCESVDEGKKPLLVEDWCDSSVIDYYRQLVEVLNAESL